ncbi:MAG: DUF4434 domain-containing protein [Terriglobia bacterium]
MGKLNRRDFLGAVSIGGVALGAFPRLLTALPTSTAVKPISGSWFEFQHASTVEGVNWNPACACFTCEQWAAKVKEIADVGMKYLVLMSTALYYRAFYRTTIFPKWQLGCADPMETVLSAADKYGVQFFIGGGFYGDWASPDIVSDPAAAKRRLQAIEELARLYGHHRSFYGWYWPNEAFIDRYYSSKFIRYVNTCSRLARQLTPRARILIAPYGTRVAVPDEKYVKQLESMDVDIIAYQDEVGVEKSKVDETSAFYEGLRKAHDQVPKVAIWADVEIFKFESKVYGSALLPAPFDRVRRQLEAVSPWVEKILVYQYQGMMNKPGSLAFAGPPDSVKLYTDYVKWLKHVR